jgi:branched-subunit amino acid ABC-type transport system permease component
MIIVICGLLTAALQLILARTRFGSRLRAAVDDPRAAQRARHQRAAGVRLHLRVRLRAWPASAAR